MQPSEFEEQVAAFFQENFRAAVQFVEIKAIGHPDPEGISAEAFQLVWEKALSANEVPTRPWLYQTLRNKLGDYYRYQRRHPTVTLEHAPELSCSSQPVEIPLLVRKCLNNLPEQHREVLVLTYWHDMSGEEAAQALEISAVAFRTRLKRAKRAFKKLYASSKITTFEEVEHG